MSTLTTLAASASGLGVAIDFAIGKAGEKRARSWLETWWLKIADIRWNNFGRREAEFAVRLMDRWYGSHLLSIRRLVFVLLFITIAISIGHLLAIVHYATGWFSLAINQSLALYILISAIGLATSLSITRLIAIFVARICQPTMWKNFSVFTAFLIITYLIMVNWLPVWHAFQQTVIFHESNSFIDSKGIGFDDKKTQPLDPEHPSTPTPGASSHSLSDPDGHSQNLKGSVDHIYVISFGFRLVPLDFMQLTSWLFSYQPKEVAYYFAGFFSGYFAYLMRLIMAFVFVGSFVVRPFLMTPILVVWARIVESQTPIFTMVFTVLSWSAVGLNWVFSHV